MNAKSKFYYRVLETIPEGALRDIGYLVEKPDNLGPDAFANGILFHVCVNSLNVEKDIATTLFARYGARDHNVRVWYSNGALKGDFHAQLVETPLFTPLQSVPHEKA